MHRVLVLSFTDLANDPRVNRQLRFLAGRYHVTAAGLADPAIDGVEFAALRHGRNGMLHNLRALALLLGGAFERYYWQKGLVRDAWAKLADRSFDLIVANDLITLPLARRLARGARILFDAHEYAPRELEDRLAWNLLLARFSTSLCRRHIPHVDAMTTVCDGIAAAYADLTGVRPTVLTNAPEYHDLAPQPYHDGARPIQLVHHGIAYPSRKLENMVLMMDHLDRRFELNLILTGPPSRYRRRIEAMAARRPAVRLLPPVPMRTLPVFLNRFDLGVFLLEPVNFNYWLALPNKLFEFIQGRLGVIIGPSPEMARVVEATGCGVVAPDFRPASLAARLQRLSEQQINAFKQRAHLAAPVLSARTNERIFLGLVGDLLRRGATQAA